MKRRKLGRTGLEISEISFGAWQLGNNDAWGHMDDITAHRLVLDAFNRGINLFDTAPNYAQTNSERLLGEALHGKRDEVVLVSKFGHTPEGNKNFSVDWFWKSLEGSLRRLKTDYIDVLLLHNPDATMYEGTDPLWEALTIARQQGKIRNYGASLDFASEAKACLSNTKSDVLEILFNIFHQDVRNAFPEIRKGGIGTIVKCPLDSGWLTGRFTADSKFEGVRRRWSRDEISQRANYVDDISWLTEDGSELTHKALAFILAYDDISCAIPGTRTQDQLQSSLKASKCAVNKDDRKKLELFWEKLTDKGKVPVPW